MSDPNMIIEMLASALNRYAAADDAGRLSKSFNFENAMTALFETAKYRTQREAQAPVAPLGEPMPIRTPVRFGGVGARPDPVTLGLVKRVFDEAVTIIKASSYVELRPVISALDHAVEILEKEIKNRG